MSWIHCSFKKWQNRRFSFSTEKQSFTKPDCHFVSLRCWSRRLSWKFVWRQNRRSAWRSEKGITTIVHIKNERMWIISIIFEDTQKRKQWNKRRNICWRSQKRQQITETKRGNLLTNKVIIPKQTEQQETPPDINDSSRHLFVKESSSKE